ncbi:MAG TPA: RNA 2',3'-cyclic phosphodiesterase [Candidatus Sulfotelmatobacter sp.]|nr:RNA 2',3'-cyclic phosphodiesterase [Candidatus Sulfotelmatobacter sp.]
MRLFVALDIDDAIRDSIGRFCEPVRRFAPEARWAKPESLHVTLKFIGEQPDAAVERIQHALEGVAAPVAKISFRGYGFFPGETSARVFWIGLDAGSELAQLAAAVDEKLKPLGIPGEKRKFSPHLTLARSPGGSGSPHRRRGDGGNDTFRVLQQQLRVLPAPEFGSMTAREYFLYQSQLSPKGSTYKKLARFRLGNL